MANQTRNHRRITLDLAPGEDGNFCIDFPETLRRTRHMVAFDKGISYNDASPNKDLSNDLNYSPQDKRDLKPLIENIFFSDVNARADRNDLANRTTVLDLASRIHSRYIPNANTCP